MQYMRPDSPVNTLQMQVSPSVVLRGTRLWNKPGDLRSPCLSQNAMRMGRLRRSVLDHPWLSFTLHLPLTFTHSLVIYPFTSSKELVSLH